MEVSCWGFLRCVSAAAAGIVTIGRRSEPGYDERTLALPELLDVLGGIPVRAIGTRYRT